MTLPTPSTLLLGIAVESTIWGGYAILFLFALVLCYRHRVNERPPRTVLVMSALLFVACATHLICGLDAIWAATDVGVQAITRSPGDTVVPFCNTLGLLILVYRCWLLWDKQTWVVFPAGAAALLGFALTTHFTYVPSDPDGVLNTILFMFGHTLLLYSNLSTTPLIAAGLDRLSHRISLIDKERASLLSTLAVLIECGLVQLITQAVYFLFVLLDHPLKYVIGGAAVQIYGFTAVLGILRTLGHTKLTNIGSEAMEEGRDEEVDQALMRAFFMEGM
ncbi:hypothetical protein L226DRAFT_570645 [Lentinus tigrinus ALCF2SS1-7]|uniref:uncharacterized protein n=1 Tax=Lentinus tigrinus ALCF2SS1-7 TaxID=1328758 RepID=UPI0011660AE5|nr:hypothetical protein L226DRAFT_570645 [Lentinus tigrinus ALCF2SS1-7]